MRLIRRCSAYVRMHGAGYTLHRLGEMVCTHLLRTDDRAFRQQCASAQELAFQRANLPGELLLSVVIPVYNTRADFLQALTDSLLAQSYPHWEACLCDGGSTRAETLHALRHLQQGDPRFRILFSPKNGGISGNTNEAAAMAQGEYIVLCDHDDVLAPDALWRVAQTLARSSPDLLYTDEDKLSSSGQYHTDPHRKPDFCPDNLRSANYICHMTVIRRTLWTRIGGLRSSFDGSQDHDLMLRVSECTNNIVHLPLILYHWRTFRHSMSHERLQTCLNAAARAVEAHMTRIGYPGTCRVEDGVLRLRYDVADASVAHLVISEDDPVGSINRQAAAATQDMLLFTLSGLPEPDEDGLREMMMYAQRRDVAAVTPLIQDRRGRVLHAGYDLLSDGTVQSRNAGLPSRAGGWHGLNRTSYNVSAVSPACFLIRREAFQPLDASLPLHQSMVQWCLAQSQRGLYHVFTPHCLLTAASRAPFQPFHVDLPKDWYDPCQTGSSRPV